MVNCTGCGLAEANFLYVYLISKLRKLDTIQNGFNGNLQTI